MEHPLHQHFSQTWKDVAQPWLTWGDKLSRQTRAATTWILELARARPGMRVLDLASGVGDPALDLANAVGPDGDVLATDLVPGALQQLEHHAATRGLRNLRTRATPMEQLPLPDASLDVVTCRLGLMFCTQLDATLAEIRRVLRPGGRFCAVCWGTPDQPLFAATLAELPAFSALTADAAQRPGPFRFAAAGTLTAALQRAGFTQTTEETRTLSWPWPGPPAEQWRAMLELSGPMEQDALEAAAHARVVANLEAFVTSDGVDTGAVLVGAAAVR